MLMKFQAGYRPFGRPPITQQSQYIYYWEKSKSVFLRIANRLKVFDDRNDLLKMVSGGLVFKIPIT